MQPVLVRVDTEPAALLLFRQQMGGRDVLLTVVDTGSAPHVDGAELILSIEPPDFPGGDVYAFAVPIAPGRTDDWLNFAHDISGPRRSELLEQRQRLGLKETLFLKRGQDVDLVIPVIEGERPWEEDHRIAASQHPFDRWFIERIADLHGIDFSLPPPPRNELLFAWRAPAAGGAS